MRRRFFRAAAVLALCAAAPIFSAASDAGALIELGKKQYDKGDYSKALQTFLKLKKEDPANPVAKEYISKTTEKIMEKEKESRRQKSILHGEPPSATIAPKDPAPAWTAPIAKPAPRDSLSIYRPRHRIPRSAPLVPAGVLEKEKKPSPYISQRDLLTQGYKNKILEGRAIDLVRKGKRVEIVAFLNRLFLPFSDVLMPDAVPAIESVVRELRSQPRDTTVLRAIDSLTPGVRHQMLDLPARRMSTLFSYIVHSAAAAPPKDEPSTFAAADLDD